MSGSPGRSRAGRASLLTRLANWWEGVEPAPPPIVAPAARPTPPPAPPPEPPREPDFRFWSAERLEAAQLLYGVGWISPGGEALYRELVTPLTLNETHSVVLHGAALGGAARMIAEDTGAWVDAIEDRPLLAAQAARHVKAVKKVIVTASPLATCDLRPRSRHAVISFEALHRVADKARELARLTAMLKPGGQMLVTDFVRKSEDGAAALERWARSEPAPVHFATASELQSILQRQGLDVRICEDRSSIYCRVALNVLQEFLKKAETQPVPARLRAWLIREVEALTVRLQALDGGAVGHCRLYGLLPG